ncbi:MAG: stage II sporulation protein D [Lysinibacillus sp.]
MYALPLYGYSEKNESVPKAAVEQKCEVFIQVEGQKEKIPLEMYIKGVVSAEMPASFHKEALKAQAIAARTYALKTTNYGRTAIAPTVARQVFIDESTKKYEKKIVNAVEKTAGQVLMYDGELITAMFHSTSNGKTESAFEYGGHASPYLLSVSSDADRTSPKYSAISEWTLAEWNNKWQFQWTLADFKKMQIVKNESGRVKTLRLNGNEWAGRDIRTMLDLRSTDFTIAYDANSQKVLVTTKGYGHGVGMSQYGAEAMAVDGTKAEEILKHYYQNVQLKQMDACLK